MNIETRKLMKSEGVGYLKSKRLIEEFDTYEAVKSATIHRLQEVHGIGPVLSRRISERWPDG